MELAQKGDIMKLHMTDIDAMEKTDTADEGKNMYSQFNFTKVEPRVLFQYAKAVDTKLGNILPFWVN